MWVNRAEARRMYLMAEPAPLAWQARAVVFVVWLALLILVGAWLALLGALAWAGWNAAVWMLS